MKTRGRLALLAVAVGALAAVAMDPVPKPPGYGVEVKISPRADSAKQFVCTATVTDLATGKIVFAPRMEVLAGKSNVASSGEGKLDFLLSVSVEGEAKEARYTLEIHDGETLVASEKAAVKLR
ncbi:MAG TPA: hypothetical protein VMR54_09950 [Thermoanaerobaculia bacterium]|nr:hypothetical protein [Thermoanaerobaculia bacterium]